MKSLVWLNGGASQRLASGEFGVTSFDYATSQNLQPGQTLIEVLSPFGLAEQQGIDLNQELYDSPEAGEERLNDLATQTQVSIARAFEAGFSGIFYRLIGAEPSKSTPMQYGGHFLEVDREILAKFAGSGTRVVFVEGTDVYFDFVSDLPCEFMGWDRAQNSLTLDEAKEMRPSGFALDDPKAEVQLILRDTAKASH